MNNRDMVLLQIDQAERDEIILDIARAELDLETRWSLKREQIQILIAPRIRNATTFRHFVESKRPFDQALAKWLSAIYELDAVKQRIMDTLSTGRVKESCY